MPCHGNGSDHCCYVEGKLCPFLETDTIPGRHWVCGKRRVLGSWSAVHSDPEYIAQVKSVWERHGVPDCGDFRGAEDGSILQCCFASQYPITFNRSSGLGTGASGSERRGRTAGEASADRAQGARAEGRSS